MGLFDNAESVMINNKEVQSIIDSNGGVLYEKVSSQPSYVLTVTSDKDALSYYDNESATLTATLTNNGIPVEGETVIFESNKPVMILNSNGDYDNIGRYFKADFSNMAMGDETKANSVIIGDKNNLLTGKGLMFYKEETNILYLLSSPTGQVINNDIVYFNGNTLNYINSKNTEQSYNISNIDLSLWNFDESFEGYVSIFFYKVGVTDVNGQCSVTYDSHGIGDVSINVECMNVSEIYAIEDCIIYDESEYSWVSGTSETFHDMYPLFDFDANNDFELYIDFYQSSVLGTVGLNPVNQGTTVKYHLNYGQSQAGTALYWGNSGGTETAQRHSESGKINQWLSMKFIKIENTVSIYRNDILYDSVTNSEVGKHGNMNIGVTSWSTSKTLKVKNLKLKQL